jgi:hypothetical protein
MQRPHSVLLIALDSVGIDPLGHDRPDSIFSDSEFLFPRGQSGSKLHVSRCSPSGKTHHGVLVETDVTGGRESGAIECAITYTSLFSGIDTLQRHGLMQGLGLNERVLESQIDESNLFTQFDTPCLVNAVFPLHFPFFQGSYVQEELPHVSRDEVEARLTFRGRPVRLLGPDKHGVPVLFTAAEINQNIFVYAARQAGVRLRTWDDVRRNQALTGSMTNELENEFNFTEFDIAPLPRHTPQSAAALLVELAASHDLLFYKYQLADLVSHSGRVELARETFAAIEQFIAAILEGTDADDTTVVITSDHGHLEQVGYSHGHPKSKVPTWWFGPGAADVAPSLATPQGIFAAITSMRQPA